MILKKKMMASGRLSIGSQLIKPVITDSCIHQVLSIKKKSRLFFKYNIEIGGGR